MFKNIFLLIEKIRFIKLIKLDSVQNQSKTIKKFLSTNFYSYFKRITFNSNFIRRIINNLIKKEYNNTIIDMEERKITQPILRKSSLKIFKDLKSSIIEQNLFPNFLSSFFNKFIFGFNIYFLSNIIYNSNWKDDYLYIFLSYENFNKLKVWNKKRGKFKKESNYIFRLFCNFDFLSNYFQLLFKIKDYKSINIILNIYKLTEIFHGAGIHFLISHSQRKNFISQFWIKSLYENYEKRNLLKKRLLRRKYFLEFLNKIFIPIDLLLKTSIRFIDILSFIILTFDQINKNILFRYYGLKFSKTIKNFKSIKISHFTILSFSKDNILKILFYPLFSNQLVINLSNFFLEKLKIVINIRKKNPLLEIMVLRIFNSLNVSTKIQEIFTYLFLTNHYLNIGIKLIIYIIIYFLQSIIEKKNEKMKKEISLLTSMINIFDLLDQKQEIKNIFDYFKCFKISFKNFKKYKNFLFELIFKKNLKQKEIDDILNLPIY